MPANSSKEFKIKVEVEEQPTETKPNPASEDVKLPEPQPVTQPQPEAAEKPQPQPVTLSSANQPQIKPIILNSNHSAANNLKTNSSLSITAIFISFLISLLIGGLIIFGIFYYKGNFSGSSFLSTADKTPIPIPTNELIQSPEPTAAEVNLDEVKIQVLNGSGISGEASVASNLLEEAGFEDIDTANARTYDHTETEISTYPGMPVSVTDAIKDALVDYDTVVREDLDEDYQYDVVIILGTR